MADEYTFGFGTWSCGGYEGVVEDINVGAEAGATYKLISNNSGTPEVVDVRLGAPNTTASFRLKGKPVSLDPRTLIGDIITVTVGGMSVTGRIKRVSQVGKKLDWVEFTAEVEGPAEAS